MKHSCNELGVCQARTPSCAGCTHMLDATPATMLDAETPTSFDSIAYWLAVGATTVASIAVLAGLLGFVAAKLGLTG